MSNKKTYISPVGEARYPKINFRDDRGEFADNKYHADIKITKEQYKQEVEKFEAIAKDLLGKAYKKGLKLPVAKTTDNKTGEEIYVIKSKSEHQPAVFKDKGDPVDLSEVTIRGGSKIRVGGAVKPYPAKGAVKGLTLYLNQVKLVELAEGHYMFDDEDDGFDQTDDEGFDSDEEDSSEENEDLDI